MSLYYIFLNEFYNTTQKCFFKTITHLSKRVKSSKLLNALIKIDANFTLENYKTNRPHIGNKSLDIEINKQFEYIFAINFTASPYNKNDFLPEKFT